MPFRPFARGAAAALLLASPLAPVALRAQTPTPPATIVADAYLNGAYVWRGVTFTNRPVLQGDLSLAIATSQGLLTGGAWGNAEPRDYTGAHDIRLVMPGKSGPALTAITTWLDLTRTAGRVSATGGVTSYWYPAITGAAAQYNTSEVYGRVAVAAPLSPKLAVYMDVEKVRGAYAEGSLTQPVPVGPCTLTLGAVAGASAGQAVRHNQSAYFAHDGLAFVDFSATTALTVGGVALAPSLHVLIDHDPATRVTALDGVDRPMKSWVGLTATWAHAVPRPRR